MGVFAEMPAKARKTGLDAVVDRAVSEPQAGPVAVPEQVSLLPLAVVGELGEDAAGEPVPALPRRGGRPVGARNRKTQEWVDFILRRYPSPLVALAETMSRPVGELAHELGCTKLEAFDRQIEAAKHLAPYLHQKLPTELNVATRPGVNLVLSGAAVGFAIGDPDVDAMLAAGLTVGVEALPAPDGDSSGQGDTGAGEDGEP